MDTSEMVAIKKVLQDKRFKVRLGTFSFFKPPPVIFDPDSCRFLSSEPGTPDHEEAGPLQHRAVALFLLLQWRKGDQKNSFMT